LLADRHEDGARLAVDAVARVGIADRADRASDDRRDVYVGDCRDLSCDKAQAGRDKDLAYDPPVRVVCQDRVQNRVAGLVRDLVGVPFTDTLGSEQTTLQGSAFSVSRVRPVSPPPAGSSASRTGTGRETARCAASGSRRPPAASARARLPLLQRALPSTAHCESPS